MTVNTKVPAIIFRLQSLLLIANDRHFIVDDCVCGIIWRYLFYLSCNQENAVVLTTLLQPSRIAFATVLSGARFLRILTHQFSPIFRQSASSSLTVRIWQLYIVRLSITPLANTITLDNKLPSVVVYFAVQNHINAFLMRRTRSAIIMFLRFFKNIARSLRFPCSLAHFQQTNANNARQTGKQRGSCKPGGID